VRDNATLYLVTLELAKLPVEWSQECGAQYRFTGERLCHSNAIGTPAVNLASCGIGYRIHKVLTTQSVLVSFILQTIPRNVGPSKSAISWVDLVATI
jgi:hypothetical protein